MIDTDKYEGHTEGEWRVDDKVGLVIKHGEGAHDYVDMENKANAQLMADAPLLLEELKRLRGILGDIIAIDEWGGDGKDVGITITWKSYEPLDEDYTFTGWLNKCYNEVKE